MKALLRLLVCVKVAPISKPYSIEQRARDLGSFVEAYADRVDAMAWYNKQRGK